MYRFSRTIILNRLPNVLVNGRYQKYSPQKGRIMKKVLFTLILSVLVKTNTAPTCLTLTTTDFKTGVKGPNAGLLKSDCTCQCRGPRTDDNTCLECRHKKMLTPEHGKIIQDPNHHQKEEPAVDLVTTGSATPR